MDRAQRIASFWNWLPAFRCIAEYGSIQKASQVLHVSPSALSRTIRLLEDAVGAPLFVRSATGLTLTLDGTDLLRGTREAMRRVDDALSSERPEMSWRVGATEPIHERLLARALGKVPPGSARLVILATSADRLVEELLRGDLDLALVDTFVAPDDIADIVVEPLGQLRYALFAAGDAGDGVVVHRGVVVEDDLPIVAQAATIDGVETLAEALRVRALLPIALAASRVRPVETSTVVQTLAAVTRRPLEGDGPPWTKALVAALAEVAREA